LSTSPDSIALIILAAGNSSRMGSAKQLLQYRGKTLLRHAVDNGLACGCSPVIVVLGHDAQRMRDELAGASVVIADNLDWQQGMGTSIRVGVTTAQSQPTPPAAVMIALVDQPLVDATVMRRLMDAYRTSGYPMAAAVYAGTVGVPAIFNRNYFDALKNLPPHAGAKKVLTDHAMQVAKVDMDEARIDIDTEQDYKKLNP
jgi:molybdenum cofactor cytidylyltransferase